MITNQTFRLDGKIAVVTGASEGIGSAVAVAYADAGATVILCARRLEKLEEVKAEITAKGGKADVFALDVSNLDNIRALKDYVEKKYGKLDVLYNNAAFTVTKPSIDVTEEEFDKMIDISFKGVYFSCTILYDLLKKGNPGKIINMASTMSSTTVLGRTLYSGIKAAISRLTGSLAVEWAPDNILVNAVAPTAVKTPSRAETLQGEFLTKLVARIPLGRVAETDDLLATAIYLASPATDFITGQTIYVDGGWTAW